MTFTLTELARGRWRVTSVEVPWVSWVTYGTRERVEEYLATHAESLARKVRWMRGDNGPRRPRGEAMRQALGNEYRVSVRKAAARSGANR